MKRAFTLIETLVVTTSVVIVAAILWPLVTIRSDYRRAMCQSNLKQIGLAFEQYTQDSSGRFPSTTASRGWSDLLQPYLKSTAVFQCPGAPMAPTNFSTDYFYNRRLARVGISKIRIAWMTILSGDGNDNAPNWNSWMQLPADAQTNEQSPTQRHRGLGNYLFADGHVKALKPDVIVTTPPKSGAYDPTFALR